MGPGAMTKLTAVDRAAEKARNRAVASEVNTERKKLEKLAN